MNNLISHNDDNDPLGIKMAILPVPAVDHLGGWVKDLAQAYVERKTDMGRVLALTTPAMVALVDTSLTEVNPTIAKAEKAMLAWSANERQTVVELAIAKCCSLMAALENIKVEGEPVDTELQDHVCHVRAELSSIAMLLHDDRVLCVLKLVDDMGEEAAAMFDVVDDPTDFQRAVSSLLPDEWWTRHVRSND